MGLGEAGKRGSGRGTGCSRTGSGLRDSPAAWESDPGTCGEELQGGGPREPGPGQRAAAGPGQRGLRSRRRGMWGCELAPRTRAAAGEESRGEGPWERTRGRCGGLAGARKLPRVGCRAGSAHRGVGAASAPGVGERVGRLRRLRFSRRL